MLRLPLFACIFNRKRRMGFFWLLMDREVVQDVFSWGYARGLKLIASTEIDPKTNVSIGASNGQCLDIDHGIGPVVGLYGWHGWW